jgi:predicted transcriptional regulator
VPLIFVPSIAFGAGCVAGLLALCGFHCGQLAQSEFRPSPNEFALSVWREWMRRESEHEQTNGSSATLKMRFDILQIYENDPRGEVFPIQQAFRLIDTYSRQQFRLQVVESHLQKLREARRSLQEKAARLRELGDAGRDVGATLSRIEADLPALETLVGQICASCLRLEALLVAVQASMQVKQLHQDLDEITSAITPQAKTPLSTDDLSDIEAQITREVETFLQLEREADAHLRQL